jgi:ankyrin repeat protein
MLETVFEYSRIDLDRPAFRLIRLLGGSQSDIDCELLDAYLDEVEDGGVPYEALSYTWGGMEKTCIIRINGMKMSVTENLFIALRYLRPEDGYRILWIDAICIDQGHHQERGHQVQQMGEIYKKAERVIVWLGIGIKDSDFLMDFLKTLPLDPTAHPPGVIVPPDLQVRYHEALENLLRRPWFRRVWVLQEVANARRADIVCGWKSVSTRTFTAAPFLLGMEPNFHSKAVLDVMPGRLRESSWYSQLPTLRTLLQNFHGSEASDKRDMIYALLGMSSSVCERKNLRADYNKGLHELIRHVTSILLFPECPDTSSCNYIDWSWTDFIQNLETLSSAAFSCAMRRGQVIGMEQFLNRDDFNVDWKDKSQRTPLWWASECGNDVMVKLLAAREDTEVNSKDMLNQTPLWIAAEQGHEGVVRTLLKISGIKINSMDNNRETPLYMAAERGHEGVVRALLEVDGIEVDLKGQSGKTPLWMAAERGHGEVVRALIEVGGFAVNAKNETGKTLLWIAADRGHERLTRALLEIGGIEVNSRDRSGKTPLHIAAERAREGVVRALLEVDGIKVNSKDEYGRTPLHMAAYYGNEVIVRELLGSDGINSKTEDNLGRTPLTMAKSQDNGGVVRALLENE